ncbi:ceramidase [Robertkochia flava]|uniref:ceramidase n=1 Tax=Robertkochia flava TaxID=3447986 RepID=UPI001CC9C582|nr:ceramidase [Robertkochia marina]
MVVQYFPNDTGPIYAETLAGRFPVEPFNTFSNLVFFFILVYWGVRVYRRPMEHRFLAYAMPLLGVGWLGGTLYHATRSHEVWLLMDWVPILLLCFAAVMYFIFKLVRSTSYRLLIIVVILGISAGMRWLPVPAGYIITIDYLISAATVLVPLVWYLKSTNWVHGSWVFLAIMSFVIALFFRYLDSRQEVLEYGTHWLWHLFGGISVFLLFKYIYEDKRVLPDKVADK